MQRGQDDTQSMAASASGMKIAEREKSTAREDVVRDSTCGVSSHYERLDLLLMSYVVLPCVLPRFGPLRGPLASCLPSLFRLCLGFVSFTQDVARRTRRDAARGLYFLYRRIWRPIAALSGRCLCLKFRMRS